ncbi:hypothetical protein [Sphingobium sp. AntQ-1]|uniref:hypothetical protein n=1 Tax=Sphingobium sp. AntQ-1 TaxID=2930091 RepID=UPI00234E5EC9|nr:hypothetical protein [Sphingobium sp. AntQ-1]
MTPIAAAPAETAAPAQSTPAVTPMQEAAPAPVAQSPARTDQAMLWALGGGALLLLGLGGAALMRRRRPDEDAVDARVEPVTYAPAPIAVTPAPAMAASARSRPARRRLRRARRMRRSKPWSLPRPVRTIRSSPGRSACAAPSI